MQQKRAPPVLPHHAELARATVDEPVAVVDDEDGIESHVRARYTSEKVIKVSDCEMATLNSAGDEFYPKWNCTVVPRRPAKS
jgi:hypothetical protein